MNSITPRENMLLALSHQKPEWIPLIPMFDNFHYLTKFPEGIQEGDYLGLTKYFKKDVIQRVGFPSPALLVDSWSKRTQYVSEKEGLGAANIGSNIEALGKSGRMFLAGTSVYSHPDGAIAGVKAIITAYKAYNEEGITDIDGLKDFARRQGEEGFALLRVLENTQKG